MELVPKNDDDSGEPLTEHKFVRMLVGAVVGFVASGLAEKSYDGVVQYLHGKAARKEEK